MSFCSEILLRLVLVVVALLMVEATGHASIIVPALSDIAECDLDNLQTESTSGTTSASQSAFEIEQPSDTNYNIAITLFDGLTPWGATSTSGSTTGTSSSQVNSGVYCAAGSALSIEQDDNSQWLTIEYSLSIPDSPVSSMLRPPQDYCII